jgi:hypothetical protein
MIALDWYRDLQNFKAGFFDRDPVRAYLIRLIGRANYRGLYRLAMAIRKHAQFSIRERKSSSKPGQPPHSHLGLLKQHIYAAFDVRTNTAVVGPMLLNYVKSAGKPKPTMILEYGGWTFLRRARGNRVYERRIYIEARPYMRPAMEKEIAKAPSYWRDAIKYAAMGGIR